MDVILSQFGHHRTVLVVNDLDGLIPVRVPLNPGSYLSDSRVGFVELVIDEDPAPFIAGNADDAPRSCTTRVNANTPLDNIHPLQVCHTQRRYVVRGLKVVGFVEFTLEVFEGAVQIPGDVFGGKLSPHVLIETLGQVAA
ncbi:hypothetical protein LCGC14_2879170 [marine sediment metagenome]|uniref:Uncharacterized protein n=1 Tax=marine sediment metagenome TaxID=412755 RepID=A0A0F8Y0X4_9ZZZZ